VCILLRTLLSPLVVCCLGCLLCLALSCAARLPLFLCGVGESPQVLAHNTAGFSSILESSSRICLRDHDMHSDKSDYLLNACVRSCCMEVAAMPLERTSLEGRIVS
jgi:hypothetical protein